MAITEKTQLDKEYPFEINGERFSNPRDAIEACQKIWSEYKTVYQDELENELDDDQLPKAALLRRLEARKTEEAEGEE